MRKTFASVAAFAFLTSIVGCAQQPKTMAEKEGLQAEADGILVSMQAKDKDLRPFLEKAAGYAVFPNVGKGGLIAGGASGRGIVYEKGQPIGTATLNEGSIGAQIGGQTYSELIVFETADALSRLRSGNFDIGANASAVALKAGASNSATFEDGVVVFTLPRGGLMAEATIKGQKINFAPLDQSETASMREASEELRTRPGSTGETSSEEMRDATK